MSALVAFACAALVTYLSTPLAITLAERTAFFDLPAGYKGHRKPTPYLGGTAITLGILAACAATGIGGRYLPIVGCAAGVWCLGTIDDRRNLPVLTRVVVEIGLATYLWSTGLGWTVFHNGLADLALTVVWVFGVMNAFNLMDNMDGAAATTAGVSALGVGSLALISGSTGLAPLAFATAGACLGFLPRNLTSPARIFMGDGGSLPVGMLIASLTMVGVNRGYLGPSGVVVAALLVGLVILDTTLVTVSRTRAGRPVLSGGRDHLTHRLARLLGDSPRNVALTLAGGQLLLCLITITVAQAGLGWVLLAGAASVILGALLIWQLEIAIESGPEASTDTPTGEAARVPAPAPSWPLFSVALPAGAPGLSQPSRDSTSSDGPVAIAVTAAAARGGAAQ